jgi:hypothetical protein
MVFLSMIYYSFLFLENISLLARSHALNRLHFRVLVLLLAGGKDFFYVKVFEKFINVIQFTEPFIGK